jgi:hypothetical protein
MTEHERALVTGGGDKVAGVPVRTEEDVDREARKGTPGLRETSEATMIAAHQAGMAYWKRNKPTLATNENLESLARSCGWHGEDNVAWLAGFYGAKHREEVS